MRFWTILVLVAMTDCRRRVYNEEDEAKYLQELKEQELRAFETEMKQQSAMQGGKYSRSQLGVQLDGMSMGDSTELPSELRGPTMKKHIGRHAQALQSQQSPSHSNPEPFQNQDFIDNTDHEDHWCYHCASPMDKLKPEMRKSIKNLLEMRRTVFPKDAMTNHCLSARNLTALKKQKCTYKYCQTLSIVDRNAGNSFVVRGCAEHFGAINVPELEKNDDHSCKMIHEKLEIKECICKKNKYCNAGWTKRSASDSYQRKLSILSILIWFFVIFY